MTRIISLIPNPSQVIVPTTCKIHLLGMPFKSADFGLATQLDDVNLLFCSPIPGPNFASGIS